jgi:hypothetical protein
MGWYGLDWSGSGWRPVEGSYEHGNELGVAAELAASQEGLSFMSKTAVNQPRWSNNKYILNSSGELFWNSVVYLTQIGGQC